MNKHVKSLISYNWHIIIETSFIFEENHVFIEEETAESNKVVTVDEELDGIDIDGIGNLLDLPGLMFINEECGNLKVVVDGGELTRNNDRERKSKVLQAYICQLFDECCKRDWGKYDFSCGYTFCG